MVAQSTLLRGARLVSQGAGVSDVTDVRIAGGRVAEVGRLSAESLEQVFDLDGLYLTAGFIDTHTHADCAAFMEKEFAALALANLRQGVTTQLCGNCGYSPFPIEKARSAEAFLHILPALGPGTQIFPSLRDWRDAIGDATLPTNLAPLVGHGSLRAGVMGFENRPAAESELRKMEDLLERCLQDGAFGLSSGLIYSPGTFAGAEELVRLARVAARFDAPYVTHLRNETNRVVQAVEEAIQIGSRSSASVHIAHHKAAGRKNWGRTAETLGLVDRARAQGLTITLDVYPYTAGSTALQALLPPWVQEGGTQTMLERVRDDGIRKRIAVELEAESDTWQNLVAATGWDGIVIAAAPGNSAAEGRSLAALAESAGTTPLEVLCEILIAEGGNVTIILHMMDEADVRRVLAWPGAMIGSDGILQPGRPHPRIAGSFARVLGKYVRDDKIWPLPEAIRRITSLPARRFKIPRRGTIRPGAAADVVAFDAGRLHDRATYEDPLAPPDGIIHVMVNGVMSVQDGDLTGQWSGRVLSRGSAHGI